MPGALDGIKVIDLTAVLLGPYATQMMADMGAEVIKVEPPAGDLLRNSGRGRTPKMGPIYLAVNRNKRSICLDLKKPEAIEVVKGLVRDADVFIHNNRPQAIERLGLGYDAIKAINPKIVYAYAHGYGRGGPYAEKPAFDDLVQGISGAATLQSRVDGGPPRYMPALIADKTTGLHLAIAVLGALVHRERTGIGQVIEVPMFETLVSFWMTEHMFGRTYDPPLGTMGYDRIINQYRHPFPTRDGFVCVLPYTDKHWASFFELVGRPDLAADDKFLVAEKRAQHYDELYQLLDTVMRGKTTAEWLPLLEGADIPVVPVRTLEELMDDPHLHAVDFYQQRAHPSQGSIRTMRNPMRFGATPTEYRRHAPDLGEQGDEILREAGFPQDKIEALAKSGALILPT